MFLEEIQLIINNHREAINFFGDTLTTEQLTKMIEQLGAVATELEYTSFKEQYDEVMDVYWDLIRIKQTCRGDTNELPF
jgi:hypothetical protein